MYDEVGSNCFFARFGCGTFSAPHPKCENIPFQPQVVGVTDDLESGSRGGMCEQVEKPRWSRGREARCT